MLRADYVGSRACAECHADIAASFASSAMRGMTRAAKTAAIKAPFDGAVFRFKDDTATLETRGADRFMTIASQRFGTHRYRVTKVIGGHHREDFAGLEVEGGAASRGEGGGSGDEIVLPVSWVIGRGAFRYKGYSVMSEERPGLRAGPVWRETCIFCHNTVPYLSTILGVLAPELGPRSGFQGVTVDRFLPEARRLRYRVASEGALGAALSRELGFLRGSPGAAGDLPHGQTALVATAISETRTRFGEDDLVELGIGCESCHGGARAHAADPRRPPSYAPSSDAVAIDLPPASTPRTEAGQRAEWIDRTCARCHQVLFSGYPPTWEGGLRRQAPGGSHINSGEARDFLLGACASQMACTRCHDPHGRPKNEAAFAGGFANAAGDAVCTSCHAPLASDAARAAHSHHRAAGEGSHCVACHMPRKNMGLDGRLTRYHRIGSPTDARKVEFDRPLECALCHGDKTVGALVSDMERWWNKRYDRTRLTALYSRLDENVLLATLGRGYAHEQAVAIALLGERRDRAAIPILVETLGHRYPLIREYARDALERITGAPLPVDLGQDTPRILEDARAWARHR
jgi:hypothetical protein